MVITTPVGIFVDLSNKSFNIVVVSFFYSFILEVIMKKLIIFLLISLFALTACSSGANYETIDIDDIPQKVDEGYQVLDVRETHEFIAGHIPGALNKPLSELKTGDFNGLDTNQKYIVICQSGNRSKEASTILTEEEFTILNVSQGMSSWDGDIEKN